jgi:hypothetical protein
MRYSYWTLIILSALAFACKTKSDTAPAVDNLIIAENKLEGTTSWLIDVPEKTCEYPDHHFCRRPEIEGFCSQASYYAGDTLNLFVSANPATSYKLDLYRMGYYQGKGGRLLKSIDQLKATPQEVPTAGKNNLIECKWDTAYQIVIPDEWLSGVYLGKLTTQDNHQSYVIFIVKDKRKSDFLFQCSDMTWQAYNRWPYWHAMYDEGQKPWVNTNGARISFDRPYALYVNLLPSEFNPLSNGAGEFLLWEFPLSFWMEKEGYDVSYISNTDTHADGEGLLRGKAFLSVGHDEYWTPQMTENTKRARDNGVNLLFLSGNSVDGVVYLDPSWNGKPNRITGRLPQRELPDEEEFMGSTSYGVGYGDIIISKADHWAFEGTGISNGDTLKDMIGWEYHGFPLKKDSSLIILGQGKIQPNKFADENAPDHAMVIYTTPKGNFVFNAGTCFWNMPLSTPPGFKNPVNNQGEDGKETIDFTKGNKAVERITKNLFNRVAR